MANAPTIDDRPGLMDLTSNPFSTDLESLRRKYNLTGRVLLAFDPKAANVTATAAGRTYRFCYHMKALGDQILTSMDDRNLESEISTGGSSLSASMTSLFRYSRQKTTQL
jgi:hypothetical protein